MGLEATPWPRPAAMVLLATLILGACAPDGQEGRESAVALPHPALGEMEPAVASELDARRAELDVLLATEDVPAEERGNAIGQMGRLYHAHHLDDVAEACYRQAQTLEPDRFDWTYFLGVLLSNRGELEGAVVALERANEMRPEDVPTLIRLADLELELGRLDAAQIHYEKARSQNALSAAAVYGLGRVAAAERRFEKAVEYFNKALALQPGALVIHYRLGQAYRQLGELDQAKDHLSRSGTVKVAIQDPLMKELSSLTIGSSPHMAQGTMALRQGRPAAAAAAYRRAVEADPANVQARQSLGTVLAGLGDLDGAVEQFSAAARLAPEDARAQTTLGNALAEQGNYALAVQHLRRAVELDPAFTDALYGLGTVLTALGRFDDAVSTYRRVLEIDPNHLQARSRLGTALARDGKFEESISELGEVVRQNPNDAQAHINLGVAFAQAGDYATAIREHQKALGLQAPNSRLALAHFNLGSFYERTHDTSRAVEHFRKALELDAGRADAHFELAELLVRSQRLEEALPHYTRATEIDPGHATARIREAEVLMRLGRFLQAKSVLEETVKTFPRDATAAHALARFLAGVPDASLRDGPRGLALAEQLFDSRNTPPYTETLAMALAEVGDFKEAARAQRAVLAEARRLNRPADAERLTRNLARYESGTPCCSDPSDAYPVVMPDSPFARER